MLIWFPLFQPQKTSLRLISASNQRKYISPKVYFRKDGYICTNSGVVVITIAQLHSTKPGLRICPGSNPARRISEIRDGEDLWQWSRLEIRLNTFRRSTIPQKQFIIIIRINFLVIYGVNHKAFAWYQFP